MNSGVVMWGLNVAVAKMCQRTCNNYGGDLTTVRFFQEFRICGNKLAVQVVSPLKTLRLKREHVAEPTVFRSAYSDWQMFRT